MQLEFIDYDNINDISFFESLEDLINNSNIILNPESYQSYTDPQIIYLKQETEDCSSIYQFNLITENCPPFIPQGFSPNEDGS